MRPCPYCKAEIPDDALKCMYCTSNLAPSGVESKDRGDTVTYVLDRGLIRYAKFAGTTLALFLTVGAFFYGFDIKQAAKEVREAQQEAGTVLKEIRESEQSVAKSKIAVEETEANARRTYQAIVESAERGAAIVVKLERQLNPDEEEKLLQAKAIQPGKFRDYSGMDPNRYGSKLWANGIRLTVRFLDGTETEKSLVKSVSEEWAKYANITFTFVSSGNADIRVTFDEPQAWSFVGTDALGVPASQPTMTVGLVRLLPPDKARATILHEFGHALGLVHENQIPKSNIRWNRKAIETAFGRANAEQAIYRKESFPTGKEFDPDSIMIMGNEIPKTYTLDGRGYGFSYKLSEGDKRFIALLYPRT
jgi:hypothetical protein